MKTFLRLVAPVLALVSFASAAQAAATSVAFTDVTVLPMDSERKLEKQTVVVTGDRIVQVGSASEVKVPDGARRIDGRGKFLMPGFGEMHGHNPPLGSANQYFEDVFFLYVANGVTTVRSMQGFEGQLAWREKVNSGSVVGPNLYLAGPSFSGQSVPSPESAIARVKAQKTEGWDLLKIHPGIKLEVYQSLAKTAKEVGIEFSGHIPADVGLTRAIELGQLTVDHMDGYLEYLQALDTPIESAKLKEIVDFTVAKGAWVVPTNALWEVILGAPKPEVLTAFPELKYMPKNIVENWTKSYTNRVNGANFNRARVNQMAANRKVLLKALADGKAKIIFGTDAPQIFSVPGFSIHRELRAMKDVGMSNFAILQSGTKNVGDYLKARDTFGLVAKGHRADLILLNADPLADLENMSKRSGVMVSGRWLGEDEIQARLAKIAEAK